MVQKPIEKIVRNGLPDTSPQKQGPIARMVFRGRGLLDRLMGDARPAEVKDNPVTQLLAGGTGIALGEWAHDQDKVNATCDALCNDLTGGGAGGIKAAQALGELARELDMRRAIGPLFDVLRKKTDGQLVKAAQNALVMIALNPETRAGAVGEIADGMLLCQDNGRKARFAEVLVTLVQHGDSALVGLVEKELKRIIMLPYVIADLQQPNGSMEHKRCEAFVAAGVMVKNAIRAARKSAEG